MIPKKIKNADTVENTWCGQVIQPGGYYTIQWQEEVDWMNDPTLLADVVSGKAIVNNGVDDITDVNEATSYLVYQVPRVMSYTLTDGINPSRPVTEFTFTCKLRFIFPGYQKVGIPTSIYIVHDTSGIIKDINYGMVRIWDITNNLAICTLDIQDSSIDLKNMGTIENVSKTKAIWELQAKLVGLPLYMRLSALEVMWEV